ncbi:MAG: molybdenum cofactor carrier [Legionellales bacterium]|nr:molybdenum cofactor carrier [Legionellales bacterium]
MLVEKIVSGGQTGVDRAALDVAVALGINHGGWCPRRRLCETGLIPSTYNLKETTTSTWDERTILNIRDSDATLVLLNKTPINVTDGTILTLQETKKTKKPLLIVDIKALNIIDEDDKSIKFHDIESIIQYILDWLVQKDIKILNIAGPRESQAQGIYEEAKKFLYNCFSYKADNILRFIEMPRPRL